MICQAPTFNSPMVSFGLSLLGMPKSESDHRKFVQHILDRTGWHATELAKKAGLNPSTLNRFLNEGREGHELRASTLRKLEQASGFKYTSPVPGRPLDSAPPVRPSNGFSEIEATPFQFEPGTAIDAMVKAAAAGKNHTDAWLLRSRALENLGYRPGDVLMVSLGETARPGDVVCAQFYDWVKQLTQTVFRLYQPPYLIAVTADERLLRPLVVDDNNVTVKGVVTHSFRSRHAA